MSKNSNRNSNLTPQAKEALNNFKMETAKELGLNLNNGYNGDLTSRQAGSIGGSMVKKLVEQAANTMGATGVTNTTMMPNGQNPMQNTINQQTMAHNAQSVQNAQKMNQNMANTNMPYGK